VLIRVIDFFLFFKKRCGSGIWLSELSSEYSNSNFIGIDINEIFPSEKIPKNLRFFKHNILDGIPYDDNTFDFIHIRFMIKYFSETEWKTLIFPEIIRICKPGGWIEVCIIYTQYIYIFFKPLSFFFN
jgi:ubiquinone/menaquinone biosynthesis C-methylase UbiE